MAPKDFDEQFDNGEELVKDDEFFSDAVVVAGCITIAFFMCFIAWIVR